MKDIKDIKINFRYIIFMRLMFIMVEKTVNI